MDLQLDAYYDRLQPKYISKSFYEQYTNREAPFSDLGLVVFLRTYSRYRPDLNRREKWCEVVLRVVEYSIGLYEKAEGLQKSEEELIEEAEGLYDGIYNMRIFPAGRSLWTAGTKQTEKKVMWDNKLTDDSSNWNCCGLVIDRLASFSEIFYWLLLGAGVGFNVQKEYVTRLPKLNANVILRHEKYKPKKDPSQRHEESILYGDNKLWNYFKLTDEWLLCNDIESLNAPSKSISITELNRRQDINLERFIKREDTKKFRIIIGDSKEGWCTALKAILFILSSTTQQVIIEVNYDNIRPAGELLKSFGGVSSGPNSLKLTLGKIVETIKESQSNGFTKLSALNCLDIVTWIAYCVVSGGIRRSALIALGDEDDKEFIEAKYNLYSDKQMAKYRPNRCLSNNSITLNKKPTKEALTEYFENIKSNGEPGFWLINHAKQHDPEIVSTNPCGEAGLLDKQTCNLVTINLAAYVDKETVNFKQLVKDIRLITRANKRITLGTQWHPEWDAVQKKQRLMGVSITGYDTFLNNLREYLDVPLSFKNQAKLLSLIKNKVDKSEKEISEELGLQRSARVTLVKPEGTQSLLPGVSCGLHPEYAEYYLRRVRFSKEDPLVEALKQLGFDCIEANHYPEVRGKLAKLVQRVRKVVDRVTNRIPAPDTYIFEFPVKTNAKTAQFEEPAVVQLARYKMFMENYVSPGHNASCTVSVGLEEWDNVIDWMLENWESTIGVSFLGKFSTYDDIEPYPYLPFKACKEEQYNERQKVELKENELIKRIAQYEHKEEYEIVDKDCSTGACPVR
jgi:adenosylcobalamin-dependent ribonucleoside-triphosphate reductase